METDLKMWKTNNEHVVFETEFQGEIIQVVEKNDRREMRFGNKVIQSAISLVNPDYLLLKYTRYMMLGLVLKPEVKSILHIGLGAGNLPRFIHNYFPDVFRRLCRKKRCLMWQSWQPGVVIFLTRLIMFFVFPEFSEVLWIVWLIPLTRK